MRYNRGRLLPCCTFADTRRRRPARKSGYLLDHCSAPHSSLIPPPRPPPLAFCAVAVRISPPFLFLLFALPGLRQHSFPRRVICTPQSTTTTSGLRSVENIEALACRSGSNGVRSHVFFPLSLPLSPLPRLIVSRIIAFSSSRCRFRRLRTICSPLRLGATQRLVFLFGLPSLL